jgi:HSP20 family protein
MAKASKHITVSKGTLERMPRPLFGDIDSLFDDFLSRRWMRPFGWERGRVAPFVETAAMPGVDVIDRDDEVVVRASVPGYRKEDIQISVSNSLLTIEGESKAEKKEEKGDYTRCEISRAAFTRTIALPAEVDDSKARASMKDGLLELTLPKREKAKRRSIAIS